MRSHTFFYIIVFVIYVYRNIRHSYFFIDTKKKEELQDFYTKYFSYYNLLNDKEKRKFITRIVYLVKRNHYNISPNVKNTNNEVELLICASFVQITFGYNDFELIKFNKIIVHPKEFFSRYINRNVKGLTVGSGYIHYSWEDFLKGYESENDKINLGLHELAHALYVEKFRQSDSYEWLLWKKRAISVVEKEEGTKESFFRNYGKTNLDEFWAVSVECFFEDPITFKKQYDSLYKATANLLKQDMALKKSFYNQ